MNYARNLARALDSAIDFLKQEILHPVTDRMEIFWNDTADWLGDHNYNGFDEFVADLAQTLLGLLALCASISAWGFLIGMSIQSASIGMILVVTLVAIAWEIMIFRWLLQGCDRLPGARATLLTYAGITTGFLIIMLADLIFRFQGGQIIGMQDGVTFARGIMYFGLALSWLTAVPLAVLYFTARTAFHLIVQPNEIKLDSIPEHLRSKFRKTLSAGSRSSIQLVAIAYAFYSLLVLLLSLKMAAGTIGFAVLLIAASLVTVTVRVILGVQGYAIRKAIWAGTPAILFFGAVASIVYGYVLTEFIAPYWPMSDKVVGAVQLFLTAATLITSFILLYRTTSLKDEQERLARGEGPIKPFKRKVVGFKEDGTPIYEVVQEESPSGGAAAPIIAGPSFWRSPITWIAIVAIALLALLLFGGVSTPDTQTAVAAAQGLPGSVKNFDLVLKSYLPGLLALLAAGAFAYFAFNKRVGAAALSLILLVGAASVARNGFGSVFTGGSKEKPQTIHGEWVGRDGSYYLRPNARLRINPAGFQEAAWWASDGSNPQDHYGPAVQGNYTVTTYAVMMRTVGNIAYKVYVEQPKPLDISARMSAEFPSNKDYFGVTGIDIRDTPSDVTLTINDQPVCFFDGNGAKLCSQTLVPDDGKGLQVSWRVPREMLKIGENVIAFEVLPDAGNQGGLEFYSDIIIE